MRKRKRRRDGVKEAFWRGRVEGQAKSGLGVRAFCQQQALAENSFYAWRRELAVRDRESTSSPVLVDGSDLSQRVRDLTGRGGARLAIDAIGGQATNRLARSLTEEGTVVNYGLLSGEACALDPALCIFHGVTLKGFWLPRSLGTRTPQNRSAVVAQSIELMQGGAFAIPVEATYPLDQVRSALEHAARTGRHGKVLLTR